MLQLKDDKLLAYLSGFLDGEGYFGVRTYSKQRNSVRVAVTNTNKGILLFIQAALNESEIVSSLSEIVRSKPDNRQRAWTLEISSINGVSKLCKLLIPYLIVKQRQAELLIRFTFLRKIEGKVGKAFDDEETDIYLELKLLNRRGK